MSPGGNWPNLLTAAVGIVDEALDVQEDTVNDVSWVRIPQFCLDSSQALTHSIQEEFFTVEEELDLDLPPPDQNTELLGQLSSIYGPSFSPSASPLSRTMSRLSLVTKVSKDTFLNRDPALADPTIPLHILLDVIKRHRSLQEARIVQADSYRNSGPAQHRFIVLQLERDGRDQIWLRIDRRRDRKRSLLNFAINGGTTPANDRVSYLRRLCK